MCVYILYVFAAETLLLGLKHLLFPIPTVAAAAAFDKDDIEKKPRLNLIEMNVFVKSPQR